MGRRVDAFSLLGIFTVTVLAGCGGYFLYREYRNDMIERQKREVVEQKQELREKQETGRLYYPGIYF